MEWGGVGWGQIRAVLRRRGGRVGWVGWGEKGSQSSGQPQPQFLLLLLPLLQPASRAQPESKPQLHPKLISTPTSTTTSHLSPSLRLLHPIPPHPIPKMAHGHGIDSLLFYHYWFNGTRKRHRGRTRASCS